jgi:hypothetical protein
MSYEETLSELKTYFGIHELVDETVFNKYGERAWRFFDQRLLETLLYIRVNLDKSMTINNWKWGGSFSQRGLRTNVSPLVKKKTSLYLSAHLRGGAIDFDVKDMTSIEVREWLVSKADELPHKIRLENNMNGKPISWVHLDVDNEARNPKVYLFDV